MSPAAERAMTILGMPPSMFAIFAATVAAGSLGAVHYLVVHVVLGRPFGDEGGEGELAGAERASSEEGDGKRAGVADDGLPDPATPAGPVAAGEAEGDGER